MASLLVEGEFFKNFISICVFSKHIWNEPNISPSPELKGSILNQIFKLDKK